MEDDTAKMITEGINLDELKRKFPHLYQEYIAEKIEITNLYNRRGQDPWKGYNPNYRDFLARAKTREECFEIIDYLEKRGEIAEELADELRERTKKFGPQSFGTRDKDYYSKFIQD